MMRTWRAFVRKAASSLSHSVSAIARQLPFVSVRHWALTVTRWLSDLISASLHAAGPALGTLNRELHFTHNEWFALFTRRFHYPI